MKRQGLIIVIIFTKIFLAQFESLDFACGALGKFLDKFNPAWIFVLGHSVEDPLLNLLF